MTQTLDRRQFSIAAALALLGGATMTIGCGGGSQNPSSPSSSNGPSLAPGDLAGDVTANHPAPHNVVITAAQIAAGGALVLDLFGGFHVHTLSLTAAEVAQIARRERLFKDASVNTHSNGSDPHTHTVIFN